MAKSSSLNSCHQDGPDCYGALRFTRLPMVDPRSILAHLRDPRIARHLPLLPASPDAALVNHMIKSKEQCWERDGLGHWATLHDGEYAGWGGFQRERDEWDFGLVLRPEYFRLGMAFTRQAFEWARCNTDMKKVTFLLPLSRSDRAPRRFGARLVGIYELANIPFRKWCLDLEDAAHRGVLAENRVDKGSSPDFVEAPLGARVHS